MTAARSSKRSVALAATVAFGLILSGWMPARASAELSSFDGLREARLGSSPSVEPLTSGPRRFAPLPQGDSRRYRSNEISPRCSYLRGRRVCR